MLKKIRSSTCSIRRKSIFVLLRQILLWVRSSRTSISRSARKRAFDTSVFFDEDGKAYLYFVRFNDGNVIWCAELKENLKEIKEETLTQCFKAEEPWELVLPKVVEGPSVFKQNGVYYLIYSANGYTSQDYAVGFATSDSPFGPWKKYEGNPVLHKCDGLVGVGHGAPFVDMEGKMRYVFHAHKVSLRYILAIRLS